MVGCQFPKANLFLCLIDFCKGDVRLCNNTTNLSNVSISELVSWFGESEFAEKCLNHTSHINPIKCRHLCLRQKKHENKLSLGTFRYLMQLIAVCRDITKCFHGGYPDFIFMEYRCCSYGQHSLNWNFFFFFFCNHAYKHGQHAVAFSHLPHIVYMVLVVIHQIVAGQNPVFMGCDK